MPSQGSWRDEHYLWLTDRTRRLVEFTDGRVELLPMPTERHQIRRLAAADIRLVLVGGFAGVVLGSPRTTVDLDIV